MPCPKLAQKGSRTRLDVSLPLMDYNSKKNQLKSTVYLYFLFYIMSFFCSRTLSGTPCYIMSPHLLRLPWVWQVSQTSLVFDDLSSFAGLVRYFVEFPLTGICLIFSPVWLECMFGSWGGRPQRPRVISVMSYQKPVPSTWLIAAILPWPSLWLSGLSTVKFLSPPRVPPTWKSGSTHSP